MNPSAPHTLPGRRQQGSALLEALIAILIFSLGILAVVGMQASAVQAVSDAKYRADASLLATQIIGQMRASDRTTSTLQEFVGGAGADGTAYTAWLADVEERLPGSGSNRPVISLDTATNQITVIIYWLAPHETQVHQFNLVTQIT